MAYSQQSSTAQNGEGRALAPDTREAFTELKADFAKLREDLGLLRKDIATISVSGATQIKSTVKAGLARAEVAAHDAAQLAGSELQEIQTHAQNAIRRNPLSAMAAALAIGYFLSGVSRRHHH